MDDLNEHLQALGYGNMLEEIMVRHRRWLDKRSKADREAYLFDRNGRHVAKAEPKPKAAKLADKARRQRRYREQARGGAPRQSWKLSPAERHWARTNGMGAKATAKLLGVSFQAVYALRSNVDRTHDEDLVNRASKRRGEADVTELSTRLVDLRNRLDRRHRDFG